MRGAELLLKESVLSLRQQINEGIYIFEGNHPVTIEIRFSLIAGACDQINKATDVDLINVNNSKRSDKGRNGSVCKTIIAPRERPGWRRTPAHPIAALFQTRLSKP